MVKFSREGISDCARCPLRDRNRVWGEGSEKASVVLIGEAPGRQEDQERRPFVGGAGRVLNSALGGCGIFRDKIWITNVISCRPPSNDIDSEEAQEAIKCCAPGFRAELASLPKTSVLVPMGNTALNSLAIDVQGITKARGSVFLLKDKRLAVPTFHPAYIMRDQRMWSVWKADFRKILEVSKKGFSFPKEKFVLSPKLADVRGFVEEVTKGVGKLLSVDIETTGLNPDYAKIVCIGFGLSKERSIVVPFLCQGGRDYWSPANARTVKILLQKVFLKCKLMFQNALFDVDFLQKKGFKIPDPAQDTMLIHHTIHPELPHNLGFIVSIYGKTPYWKESFNRRAEGILEMDNMKLWTYNARDCVVLHQVQPEEEADAKELEVLDTYNNISMKLIRPVLNMQNRGILLSKSRLASFKKSLDKEITEKDAKLRELAHLPPGFNLDSDDDTRLLLYGTQTEKHKRALLEWEEYKKNPKKGLKLVATSMEEGEPEKHYVSTKKRAEVKRVVEIVSGTRRLSDYLKPEWASYTEKGKASVGEESLSSILLHIQQRLSLVDKFVRKADKNEEAESLVKCVAWISLFRSYNEAAKLRSTYTSYPVGRDGRVHCRFLIHGTTSGRLSSRDPNLQNQPSKARKIFVAPPGYVLLSRDYNNLELRVAAILSQDKSMLRAFEEGKNLHDLNTVGLFKVGKEDPLWSVYRRVAKTYIFGRRLYGGSLLGIYKKIIAESPEIRLSFSEFSRFDQVIDRMYPGLADWQKTIIQRVTSTRMIRNAFGRLRIFLGSDSEIVREGLNHPVQSTAADIKNGAIIRLDKRLAGKASGLLLDIHDELLLEVKKEELKWVGKTVKEEMERPVRIGTKDWVFPTEEHVGASWEALKD